MKYKLDPSKAEIRLLSNDAFFYLKDEEDPIDDDNLEEAYEIISMFPNGFVVSDNWSYVDNDTIEATFIPYVEDELDITWDGEHRLKLNNGKSDTWAFMFKVINHTTCYARWADDVSGRCVYEGECTVEHVSGKPWAVTPKGSRLPLWGTNTKYFTANTF